MGDRKPEKQLFYNLDAMRGVAAIAVACMHLAAMTQWTSQWFSGAYLAVDLFFIMSGVVIAHAYDNRLKSGMNVGEFVWARIVRLYPLYFLGSLYGIGRAVKGLNLDNYSDTLSSVFFSLFMLPNPLLPSGELYTFNGPSWSLFFEIAVNIAFAMTFFFPRVFAVVATVSIVGLLSAAIAGTSLNNGHDWETFWVGSLRVCFGFPIGVFIYRLWKADRPPIVRIPPFVILAIIAASFLVVSDGPKGALAAVLTIVFVYVPLVFLALNNPHSGRSACEFLGKISYPLYMVHIPIFTVCMKISDHYPVSKILLAPGSVAAAIICAWLVDKYYDEPARKLLSSLSRQLRMVPAFSKR